MMVEAGFFDHSSGIGIGKFFVVVCLAVALVAVSIHALEKHGTEADAVYQCMESRGPIQTWSRDDRLIHVCEVDPGVFGLVIESLDGNPITAFIRNKAKCLADVMRYLERQGAVLEWSGR